MTDDTDPLTLARWYEESARPVLERCCPSLADTDRAWGQVHEAQTELMRGLEVGFLGSAGVGKSTLINTLVADERAVLPQGGVGPLTAQATLVRHSPEPYFRVTYHGRDRLLQLLWGLEQARGESGDGPRVELAASVRLEVAALIAADTARGEFPGGWLRQASQLVMGSQYSEAQEPYLLDGLRAAAGLPPSWGSRLTPAEERRLTRVRAVLEFAARGTVAERWAIQGDLIEVLEELRLHAAGYLSPLVRTLEVGWDGEHLVPGLVLVDLPGLGVANDESRQVTERWTDRLHALVLVVDRSGLTEACAAWLRGSRFMRRREGDAPVGPPLVVVPVKLDLSADDARRCERQLGVGPFRSWREHYLDTVQAARALVTGQLREEWVRGGGETDAWGAEAARVQIHPACAREYLRLHRLDPDDPARMRDPDETGLPPLRAALARLANEHMGRRQEALQAAETRLRTAILELIEQSGVARASTNRWELLRLRDELDAIGATSARRTG